MLRCVLLMLITATFVSDNVFVNGSTPDMYQLATSSSSPSSSTSTVDSKRDRGGNPARGSASLTQSSLSSSPLSSKEQKSATSTARTVERAHWVKQEDNESGRQRKGGTLEGLSFNLDGFGDDVEKYSAFGASVVRAARATLSVAAPMAATSQIARQTAYGIAGYAASRRDRAAQRKRMTSPAEMDSLSLSVEDDHDGDSSDLPPPRDTEYDGSAEGLTGLAETDQQEDSHRRGGGDSGEGLQQEFGVEAEQPAREVSELAERDRLGTLPAGQARAVTLKGGARPLADIGIAFNIVLDTAIEATVLIGMLKLAVLLAGKLELAGEGLSGYMLCTWGILIFLSGLMGKLNLLPTNKAVKEIATFNIDEPLDPNFYRNLRKPSWNPPNWMFAVMWIPLKILQTFACYTMWESLATKKVLSPAVVSYFVYKALGDAWNVVFFRQKLIGWAAAVMGVYFMATIASIALFYQINPKAGYLFAPTAPWVVIATSLSLSVWRLNRRPSS